MKPPLDRRRPRRHFALGLTTTAFLALAMPAFAHAFLARAEPAVGATVHGAVTALHLRLTERVEPSLCRIGLTDAARHSVPLSALNTEGDGRILVARLATRLAPGAYSVRWHAVSVDTHITEGDYVFTVAP